MNRVDCVVIGAGVIGLAVGRALVARGREVILIEKARVIGAETSSRNSEVIHAGIHYPPGSLKAVSCVAGRERLYAYCVSHAVPHRRCGKFIVATSTEQVATLEKIRASATANGVEDLYIIDRADALRQEPALDACAALVSPSTGIVDTHAFMVALLGEFEKGGGILALGARATGMEAAGDGIDVWVDACTDPALRASLVVNAAGLGATAIAASMRAMPSEHVPVVHLAKGNYFVLQRRAPFSRLIYPVPEAAGLGTHLTLDMAGAARFGPDVEWIDDVRYDVDPRRAAGFYAAVRKYWPGLRDGELQPGYAGIRPKITGPGEPAADFLISGPREHGVPGLVNLFGIESPGLTASLALAEHVADMGVPSVR